MQCFWWPRIKADIVLYLRTCHICQQQQTWQLLILPVVAMLAGLFSKVYMDTIHLPAAGGFKYIVQGRCSLIFWPEFRILRAENSTSIGDWIFQDILCRWGAIEQIVTDNSPPFIKVV